jgi:YbgC/YbaW family acyl-CoA thioester hydrolase
LAKTYHCALEVRGYELDSFGHVNHAVYVSYLEHARWKLLEEEEITLARFNEWKRWPVIAEAELSYLKPTFLGDRLDVRTRILDHGRTNFSFEQVIYRKETPVLKAKIRAVMIDERGRPSALPPEISRLWTARDAGGGI